MSDGDRFDDGYAEEELEHGAAAIIDIVNRLEDLVGMGKRVPFSSRVVVEASEFLGLVDLLRTTVPQEIQLARTEMSEKISRVTTNLLSVGAGGFVAYLGGLALVGALILAIRDLANISLAWSAFIVGAVLAIIGYVMLQKGVKELKRVDLAPRRTVETLKDDVQWAKEQTLASTKERIPSSPTSRRIWGSTRRPELRLSDAPRRSSVISSRLGAG